MNPQITKLREQIDNLDLQILTLLNKRAQLALEIAPLKQQLNIAPFQPEREAEIIAKLKQANNGPMPHQSLANIFKEIMQECLAIQQQEN